MAEANQPDDNKQDDDKGGEEVQANNVPTLDQVHERAVAGLEGEDNSNENDDDDGAGAGDDTPPAGADDGAGGDDDDDKGGGGDQDDDEPDEPPAPPAAADKPATPEPQPAAELNTDISKNGPGKVAIKNFDGETNYFNSTDEIPDDFEPASYKAFAVGMEALADKRATDRQAEAQQTEQEQQERVAERKAELDKSWDSDIAALAKDGTLPKDKKEQDAAVEETFEYMEKQLQAGHPIDNFTTAYWAVQGQKAREAAKQKDKETAELKKKKGGQILGGTGGTPPSTTRPRTRVLEGPPAGVTLEQAHEKATRDLE